MSRALISTQLPVSPSILANPQAALVRSTLARASAWVGEKKSSAGAVKGPAASLHPLGTRTLTQPHLCNRIPSPKHQWPPPREPGKEEVARQANSSCNLMLMAILMFLDLHYRYPTSPPIDARRLASRRSFIVTPPGGSSREIR